MEVENGLQRFKFTHKHFIVGIIFEISCKLKFGVILTKKIVYRSRVSQYLLISILQSAEIGYFRFSEITMESSKKTVSLAGTNFEYPPRIERNLQIKKVN